MKIIRTAYKLKSKSNQRQKELNPYQGLGIATLPFVYFSLRPYTEQYVFQNKRKINVLSKLERALQKRGVSKMKF